MIDDDLIEEYDDGVSEGSYVGALWFCFNCESHFVDEIPSVAEAANDRSKKGCPLCEGHLGGFCPEILLVRFLREGEFKKIRGFNMAHTLGVAKFVPWD